MERRVQFGGAEHGSEGLVVHARKSEVETVHASEVRSRQSFCVRYEGGRRQTFLLGDALEAGGLSPQSTKRRASLSADSVSLPASSLLKVHGSACLAPPSPLAMAKKLFIGANWKCSLESVEEVDALLAALAGLACDGTLEGLELCIFAPYVFLERARRLLPKEILVGSQNAWDAAEGFGCTGVVTSKMLKGIGCEWVLLGHSDRRNVLGESHQLISEKVRRCLESGLNVNITIGEKADARSRGWELEVLQEQLRSVAEAVPKEAWGRVAVAYEPVWAVGEGATPCEPSECQRVHRSLRAWLRECFGEETLQCRFLYTGSVNEKNAEQIPVAKGAEDSDGSEEWDPSAEPSAEAALDTSGLATLLASIRTCQMKSWRPLPEQVDLLQNIVEAASELLRDAPGAAAVPELAAAPAAAALAAPAFSPPERPVRKVQIEAAPKAKAPEAAQTDDDPKNRETQAKAAVCRSQSEPPDMTASLEKAPTALKHFLDARSVSAIAEGFRYLLKCVELHEEPPNRGGE
eukprot:g29929.t1